MQIQAILIPDISMVINKSVTSHVLIAHQSLQMLKVIDQTDQSN